MSGSFDIIIVGGGPAGLFAAYYLVENSDLKVLLLEKGGFPNQRFCPIANNEKCQHCNPCNILCGLGGAGLFSDGKLNFVHKLGKTDLTQFVSPREAQGLIWETEEIFDSFGMQGEVYPKSMSQAKNIRKEARKEGIELLLTRQKHLGSDSLPAHIEQMVEYIQRKGAEIKCFTEVQDLLVERDRVRGVCTPSTEYYAPRVLVAPGRAGAEWMSSLAEKYSLNKEHRGLEVGVRVEVHNDIMQDITNIIYDPTFFICTSTYDDLARTFCTNWGGYVSLENYQSFVCVNGHSYKAFKSQNTNFAFLSKVVRTIRICELIMKKNLNISWWCFSRVNTIVEREDMIKAMTDSGCMMVFIGVESPNQAVLDSYNKNITPDLSVQAIRMLHKYNIKAMASFIIGELNETEDMIYETINFSKKIHPEVAQFTILTPYPGTRLFNKVKDLIVTQDWSLYDGLHAVIKTFNFQPKELENLLKKAYFSFYTQLTRIISHPVSEFRLLKQVPQLFKRQNYSLLE